MDLSVNDRERHACFIVTSTSPSRGFYTECFNLVHDWANQAGSAA